MALAPGHRLGQIIGDMFELAVEPPLAKFCADHDLYLDGKRARSVRYDNGDKIVADFANAADAITFLESFDQ